MSLRDMCPILQFGDLGDKRGKLVVIEGAQAIPFEIKRVFYIYDSDSTVVRGQHANRESEFVLINVAGHSKVRITDGKEEFVVQLDKPMMGVYIPKMIWKDMYDFSSDSVLLVLASTHYDGTEYIRNYDEYIALPELNDVRIKNGEKVEIVTTKQPVLSLCMPTNGVSEWVFPSLESIYNQNINNDLFEVVIMDNGNNAEFRERIGEYGKNHQNLKYYRTEKALFLSEPESYKKALGELIKFVNHRNIMEEGSIQYFLDFVEANREKKPVIYFTDGNGRGGTEKKTYDSFGKFVDNLGYYSTWSSGMTIWKSDMNEMIDYEDFNYLFPHTDILFHRRNAKEYIIDGTVLWHEQPQGKKPKGNYDLFYAFAVEFPNIIMDLVRDGDIGVKEFLSIKENNLEFLANLYRDYIIKKMYCSYDLTNYKRSLSVYYSELDVVKKLALRLPRKMKKAVNKGYKKALEKMGDTKR